MRCNTCVSNSNLTRAHSVHVHARSGGSQAAHTRTTRAHHTTRRHDTHDTTTHDTRHARHTSTHVHTAHTHQHTHHTHTWRRSARARNRPDTSSTKDSGLMPRSLAEASTFCPCSSVPVTNQTFFPSRRWKRAMASQETVVYAWPTWGESFT